MKSALKFDSDLAEEFGIPESAELEPQFKIGYLRSQIDEFKKVIYRNRVDALISQDLLERSTKEKNEALEAKARENLTNYRNVIKQMTGGVEIMEKLLNEIVDATAPASE